MKTLQQCIDFLHNNGMLRDCQAHIMSFPADKQIWRFARWDDKIYTDKIVAVWDDTVYKRTTAVVYLAQEGQMPPEYSRALYGAPHIRIFVRDISEAMHLLGKFIVE